VEVGDARQTFVVRRHLLERVRDYVHARRAKGDYAYSQKQALEEALLEFLAAREPAQPRPLEAREREQQFRARVREGRQSSVTVEPSARPTAQHAPELGAG
jgi:protease II